MDCTLLPQQPRFSLNEISLSTEDLQEVTLQDEGDLISEQGALKTPLKNYILVREKPAPFVKITQQFEPVKSNNALATQKVDSPSLMALISSSATLTLKSEKEVFTPLKKDLEADPIGQLNQKRTPSLQHKEVCSQKEAQSPHLPFSLQKRAFTPSSSQSHNGREKGEKMRLKEGLAQREWKQEKTKEFWNQRYLQREKDKEREESDEQRQQEQHKAETIDPLQKKSQAKKGGYADVEGEIGQTQKPLLSPPSMGVFALYYILTKIGILSDGASHFACRNEIELIDSETTTIHQARLAQLKEAIYNEQKSASWGIAAKVFSWMGSFFAILSGVILIATGVGAVAGAMLISGGLIQITSQIMELTGAWQKIVDILPGDNIEKKRAVLSWMQIGVAVLCLILSGAGILWGGYANFGEAMSVASAMLGGIGTMGGGIATIGEGLTTSAYQERIAQVKKCELKLAQLRHKRKDLMEKVEWGIDRLEQLFEDLARFLAFEEELFYADQMINRR